VGEDRTEGAQQGKEYITVGDAAKLLGVHRNTVHHRIKVGRITAHKVVEGEREVYRIERDSLGVGRTSADVRTLDAQRTTASEELSRMIATRLDEIVRDYTHELGALREEFGAERARREMAEKRVADLEAALEASSEAAQPSGHPSVLSGSWEEAGKETARRLVGGIAGLLVAIPASVAGVISYFNNAPIETILAFAVALSGTVVALVGTWFGIKTSSDAVAGAQRIVTEANTTVEQAAQEDQEARREEDQSYS